MPEAQQEVSGSNGPGSCHGIEVKTVSIAKFG